MSHALLTDIQLKGLPVDALDLTTSIVRPPIVLDFTESGRIILEFPTQHPISNHDSICTALSAGTYTITFPAASVLTIPSGNVEPTVNGFTPQLNPFSGVIIHLPQGGSVSTPSSQNSGPISQLRPIHILGPAAKVTASTSSAILNGTQS